MNYTQRYPNPQAPPKPPRADGTVFRVTGIPLTATVDGLHDALSELLSEGITVNTKHTTISPSCHDKKTQNAFIQFTPYPPLILTNLPTNDCYQIQFGNTDINIDKDFYGLTQLYPTLGAIDADVVAVCGLNGHAYGSWVGKAITPDRRKMWLRHFFREDFPQCRTMIYGYNSNLTSNSIHTIPDYTDTFLEELCKARQSKEERNRPMILIGHSFGGIIIAQSLVKAKRCEHIYGPLSSKTRLTIFFGTPHRGFVVDDIAAMLGEGSPREALVASIKVGSEELECDLKKFILYSKASDLKIVSFKESMNTRKLKKGLDGSWSRSGEFFTAVDRESSVLQLPDTIEQSLSVEGDHSTMVKFKHREHLAYTSVVRHLRNALEPFPIQGVGTTDFGKPDTSITPSGAPIVILLMGVVGSGKSNFINKVGNGVSINLGSCTGGLQTRVEFQLGDRIVQLVDTPGFDDVDIPPADVLRLIGEWLMQLYDQRMLLHGILYFHSIYNRRMGRDSILSFNIFEMICGLGFLTNTILVTTEWDTIKGQGTQAVEERERLLMTRYWKRYISCGGRLFRSKNTKENFQDITRQIVKNNPGMSQLQYELANGMRLSETSAGLVLGETHKLF